ncbi:hypothetical protein G7Y89_g3846 [Cudoniella acicularis]|uniref:C2H2-type domain-containing protein n=1 Tax=Cudoniella acicularis TaxID=354080 RepID=A0A8H4RQK7_9HELO|nr:hypothetical protein G7Y89_g3846 [Cudoniella acicularis]
MSHSPNNPNRFPCQVPGCPKTFSRPSDAARHVKNVHNGEKKGCPFGCADFRGAKRDDVVRNHVAEKHPQYIWELEVPPDFQQEAQQNASFDNQNNDPPPPEAFQMLNEIDYSLSHYAAPEFSSSSAPTPQHLSTYNHGSTSRNPPTSGGTAYNVEGQEQSK